MIMVCPFCLHKKTDVYNSRQGAKLNTIWRRRRCPECGAQFTTHETADPASILTVQDGRHIVQFSHTKLLMALTKVCDHRTDTDESVPYIAETIEQKLYRQVAKSKQRVVSPAEIVGVTSATLQAYDPVAYVKYAGQHTQLNAQTIRKALKRKP